MRRFQMAAVGGLMVGAVGLAVASPPTDKPSVKWAESWEAARKEATARNVPIFVSFHQDN